MCTVSTSVMVIELDTPDTASTVFYAMQQEGTGRLGISRQKGQLN